MPVEQIAPPTLAEIAQNLKEYEKKYRISTVDFLEVDGEIAEVDDDDAMEWLYLVEQFRSLQQGRNVQTSRTERATSVRGCISANDAMEKLAA